MNITPHASDFDRPTHIIVWGTSQTGWMQTQLLKWHWNSKVIATWSKETTYNFWAGKDKSEIKDNLWLPLKDKATIESAIHWIPSQWKESLGERSEDGYSALHYEKIREKSLWISDVAGDILVFWKPIDITLHAMSMSGVSKTYPKEVSDALLQVGAEIASVFYISYEDGASSKNPNGSHVYYPVREIKQQMEQSALESCQDAKIIDLITFDSPSAKKLGFTFLGIVGDFVNFMQSHENHPLTEKFRETVQKFLEKDYLRIQKLFSLYPLRGELKGEQKSMKQMAEEGTLNSMIANAAKEINFARFSRISGIITELYLLLAMNDMNQNRETILKQSGTRVLLDWERISKQDMENISGDIDTIYQKLEGKTKQEDMSEFPQNWLYREVSEQEGEKNYTFDMKYIDFLKHHFGIHPYFLSLEMVKQSWLVQKDEYISEWNANSMLYTGNDLTIRRDGDTVRIINTENGREVFCEFEIKKISDMKKPEASGKSYPIPTLDEAIDTQAFPHSAKWSQTFSKGIPTKFETIEFSQSSALIEHLGFQIGVFLNSLSTNSQRLDEFKENFPAMKNFDIRQLQWKFARVVTVYQDSDLDSILSRGIVPTVSITKAAFKPGFLPISLEVHHAWEMIGKYEFRLN